MALAGPVTSPGEAPSPQGFPSSLAPSPLLDAERVDRDRRGRDRQVDGDRPGRRDRLLVVDGAVLVDDEELAVLLGERRRPEDRRVRDAEEPEGPDPDWLDRALLEP